MTARELGILIVSYCFVSGRVDQPNWKVRPQGLDRLRIVIRLLAQICTEVVTKNACILLICKEIRQLARHSEATLGFIALVSIPEYICRWLLRLYYEQIPRAKLRSWPLSRRSSCVPAEFYPPLRSEVMIIPRNKTVKLKTPGLTIKRKILGVWGQSPHEKLMFFYNIRVQILMKSQSF